MEKFPDYLFKSIRNFKYRAESRYGIHHSKHQSGGTKKLKSYRYMGNKFNMIIDDTEPNYIVVSVVGKDMTDCVTTIISDNLAIIQNVSYHKNCSVEGLKKPGGGDVLFRFILSHLIINKSKYNINRIILQDNSFLICSEDNDDKIPLANLRILTHGQPWYMKYDFKPYNPIEMAPDKSALRMLKFNRKILDNLKTKNVKIWKIVSKFDHLDKIKIGKIEDNNLLFKDFIKELSKDFDKYCSLIMLLLKKVYVTLDDGRTLLYDFHGKDYYLDI